MNNEQLYRTIAKNLLKKLLIDALTKENFYGCKMPTRLRDNMTAV